MYDNIDFIYGTNFYLNLYCLALYCFVLLFTLKGNVSNIYTKDSSNGRLILVFCGILLFSLTSFIDGDFFHYYELMSEYKGHIVDEDNVGIEKVYQYLIYFIDGDYFLFRLAVWGAALIVTVLSARCFQLNVYHTLFVIFAGFIITFSYARATLAMSIFSLGAAISCVASEYKNRKKYFQIALGLAIIASSMYFHRSMLPVIAIAVCGILMPWKKLFSRYSLWLFPLFVIVLSIVVRVVFEELAHIANAWNDDETGTLDKMEHYRTAVGAQSNINGYITLVVQYISYYLPLAIIANVFRSSDVLNAIDKRVVSLYIIVYWIFVLASSFLFIDFDSNTLFYRYLYMTFIPLSMLIVYMKDKGILSRTQYLWMVVSMIFSNLLQLMAIVYKEF